MPCCSPRCGRRSTRRSACRPASSATSSTCSTHALWAGEFLAAEDADACRFYLSLDRPEARQTSFGIGAYRDTVDRELVQRWQPWLRGLGVTLAEEFGGRVPATGAYTLAHRRFLGTIRDRAAEMEEALDARTFSSARAARVLCRLVEDAEAFSRTEDALRGVVARRDARRTGVALGILAAKTLAMLATPVMPRFAARLWRSLGLGDECRRWESDPAFVPAGQDAAALAGVGVLGE
jgi:methionyl-tRNA synthetase